SIRDQDRPSGLFARSEKAAMSPPQQAAGFGDEIRLILRRGVQVWRLVPHTHKKALGGAALVMALTSATGTAIALLLGALVDGVDGVHQEQIDRTTLYWHAGLYLGLIALAYLLREGLNVLR